MGVVDVVCESVVAGRESGGGEEGSYGEWSRKATSGSGEECSRQNCTGRHGWQGMTEAKDIYTNMNTSVGVMTVVRDSSLAGKCRRDDDECALTNDADAVVLVVNGWLAALLLRPALTKHR